MGRRLLHIVCGLFLSLALISPASASMSSGWNDSDDVGKDCKTSTMFLVSLIYEEINDTIDVDCFLFQTDGRAATYSFNAYASGDQDIGCALYYRLSPGDLVLLKHDEVARDCRISYTTPTLAGPRHYALKIYGIKGEYY